MKGKESRSVASTDDGWKTSMCFEADFKMLVDEGLFQSKEVIQWHATTGDKRPFVEVEEIVLFQHFVERGFARPTSDFLPGLLFNYGIQFCIILIPIPFFTLLFSSTSVNPFWVSNPNLIYSAIFSTSTCNPIQTICMKLVELDSNWSDDGKKYIPYKFPTSLLSWRERWFFIRNHEPSLLERTTGALKITDEWTLPCQDMSKIEELLKLTKERRNRGVTGVSMMYSWIVRRIQPLQKRTCLGFEYLGLSDPSRLSADPIGRD